MNRGLMLKSAQEIWSSTLTCGLMLGAIEALLAFVLPTFEAQFTDRFAELGFIREIIGRMLGSELTDQMGPAMFAALPWSHPVVFALVWAHAVTCCTRMPAGEIDAGTIDVTLGLPVSRGELLRSETIVCVVAALVVLGCALAGNVIGGRFVDAAFRPDPTRRLVVLANLLCVYLVVSAAAWLVSSLCDRRSKAITTIFAILLVSFVLNYLVPFWPVAARFSFLSLLSYHRPLFVLRDGVWPVADMAILITAAAFLWTAAALVFARRDICTV